MSDIEVLVVGAGALGLSSAWHLARRGASVTVVDAEYPAGASSGLSVGMVQTQHLTRLNIELRAAAMRCFTGLAERHGLDIVRCGYMRVGFSADQMEAFERSVEIQREFGIDHPRLLDRRGVHELVPDMFVDDVEGALYGSQDGFIDGHLYCGVLLEILAEIGVPLLPKFRVEQVERTSAGRHRVTSNGRVLEADVVVNAAGAWAPQVAAAFGTAVTLRPERHQAVMARLGETLPYIMPCVMNYSPGSGSEGIFFRHERPGQLCVGLHSLEPVGEVVDPDDYRRSNDLEFLESVAEQFQYRLPSFEDAQLGGGWAGIYPMTDDGLPIVGPATEEPTVVQAVGGGGAGIMLSPAIGALVSEWILDGRVSSIAGAGQLTPASRLARGSRPLVD